MSPSFPFTPWIILRPPAVPPTRCWPTASSSLNSWAACAPGRTPSTTACCGTTRYCSMTETILVTGGCGFIGSCFIPVSYTHLRAHETRHDLVCRLLLEKKKKNKNTQIKQTNNKKKTKKTKKKKKNK